MGRTLSAPLVATALLVGMVVLLEVGRRIGLRRLARDPGGGKSGVDTLKGVVFGLTSLVLAFSFAGALTRYDARRELIVVEANAIGTAYLRVDLLPRERQPGLRETFRSYVDTRLEVYRKLPDVDAARQVLARSAGLQNEIWAKVVVASREAGDPATTTLAIQSVNDMIDITTTRTVAALSHPPWIITAMIFGLTLACALVAGQDMALNARSWPNRLAFAIILALTVYVIIEVEYPRAGLVRLDAFDSVLGEVRESMK